MKASAVSSKTVVWAVHFGRRCLLLPLFLTCFPFGQMAQAVSPAPDGGYPNNNTAEGTSALFSLSSGVDNTALGFQALYHNTTSSYNTAEGFRALFSNNVGTQNTATGLQGLFSNTTGNYNTAAGVNSLFHNISGAFNTATGVNALFSNTTAGYNTADGVNALYRNTGTQNTATGMQALFNNVTGSYNTADGVNALYHNTSGSGNIAIGNAAGLNLTVGSNNIDIGNQGVAGESGIIRVGTEGVQTDIFPAGRIHIGSGFDAAFKIEPSDGSPDAGFIRFGDNTGWQLRFARSRESSGGPLNTGTSGTIMTLTDNGNVGIGAFPGTTRLDVSGAGLDPGTPQGHVVLIHDRDDAKTAGLAIQSSAVTGFSALADNFITFFNDNGASIGSIEGNGSGGVQLGGPGSDYAEYLPKDDPSDEVEPTQIVGVRNGRVVPRGTEADQYMVVTGQAIVAGNRPSEDEADLNKRSLVSFTGQVPVQVRGPVQSGDFILAAENGTGIAVQAGNIPPSAMHRVVGRAWETSAEEGIHTINTAVGMDQTSLVVPALERLERENRQLRATVEQQQKQIQLLAAGLTEHETQIQKVGAQLKLNKAAPEMAANP